MISPETAFKTDSKPLTYLDAIKCAEAFLHTKDRQVDKTGCISFDGSKYEVGMDLIGRKVEIYYDPLWTDEIGIHHKDKNPYKVKRLEIGENCVVKTKLPDYLTETIPKSSRMLDGLNKANITHRSKVLSR